jgi:hypothetical protein
MYFLLIILVFFLLNKTNRLEDKLQKSILNAKEHETKAEIYFNEYIQAIEKDNALKEKYDSLKFEKNKYKTIYNEKIKIIDKYSISDMQLYFNNRTK